MSELFHEQLQALRAQSLYRKLREIGSPQGAEVEVVGEHVVNFSSHDYLALANEASLREAASAAIAQFGVGAGASRLSSGTQSPHARLEAGIAKWHHAPAALSFSSGYAAALGTIPALVGKHDFVIIDKLCHAALVDGAKLSGATVRGFSHNHVGKLESLLETTRHEHPDARLLIATESIFAIDGDRAPLRQIVALKRRYGATLLVDEARAIGIIGAQGRGLAAEENVSREIDVQLGSFGKALGVSGGFVCGSRSLIEWLVNRARSFVHSTAPPPAIAAAATAAIEFVSSETGEQRRLQLWQRIEALRSSFAENRIPNPGATANGSAIHSLMIGDERQAIDLARALKAEGLLVAVTRYPTVAKGAARVSVNVTAGHSDEQIRCLAENLGRLRPELASAA